MDKPVAKFPKFMKDDHRSHAYFIASAITRKTSVKTPSTLSPNNPSSPTIMQTPEKTHDLILILDFGSQYSHLIARRLRDTGIYCELVSHSITPQQILSHHPRGLILSGGPASVYSTNAPHVTPGVLQLDIPILGICYGLQEIVYGTGGKVEKGLGAGEFGRAKLKVVEKGGLLDGLEDGSVVWMSHGDCVGILPRDWKVLGSTSSTEFAAVADRRGRLFGLQFHPEVTHTEEGEVVLGNFAKNVCGCKGDWSMKGFLEEVVRDVRGEVGDEGIVVGAVSGGVDSTVAAVLMKEAIGDRFRAVLVDNGVLRKNESQEVLDRLRNKCGVKIDLIDAGDAFLERLEGVEDPETKRKVIGRTFIEVFDKEAKRIGADFLLQGTLYPDVIESVSHKGPSATIKTHHNVGGLPEKMNLKLIEPLRYLFKDEVRKLGVELGVPEESVWRHPFPGPGLAIRILGKITRERLQVLREADAIFIKELRNAGLYRQIGQAFAVLLPVKAVGVMGDRRTYKEVITLRAVKTTDYMTADWFDLPSPLLRLVSSRIVNEISGVNRVTYDITSKPPGTIEWE